MSIIRYVDFRLDKVFLSVSCYLFENFLVESIAFSVFPLEFEPSRETDSPSWPLLLFVR